MEKKKINLFITVTLTSIIVLIGFLVFLNFSKKPSEELIIFMNVEDLYPSLKDNMKDFIDLRLSWLGCEPEKYYGDDSRVCFLCNGVSPCFGYNWSEENNEEGKREIAPPGPYLEGVDRFTIKMGDFCYRGLASALDCHQKDNNSLDCGEVSLLTTFQETDLHCLDVRILLKKGASFEDFVKRFCETKGQLQTEERKVEELAGFPPDLPEEEIEEFKKAISVFGCGEYGIKLFKNTGIITTWK